MERENEVDQEKTLLTRCNYADSEIKRAADDLTPVERNYQVASKPVMRLG